MENGSAEAEPGDVVANDVASAALEDAPASDTKLEVTESVEDDVSDHPKGEAVSGLPSPSLKNELTVSTDDELVKLEGTEESLADSTSLDPEVPVDSPSAVGTVDDSETSGMEMGSSEAEDVISPEESDPSSPKGSEQTPRIDEKDFGNFQVSENLNDAGGENAGGSLGDESLDSAETSAPASETLVETDNTEDSEIPAAKEGDNSPVEGDAAANVQEGEESLNNSESESIASLVTDDTAPEGTVEGPRDDNLAENAVEVTSDVPTSIMPPANVVDEGIEEPEIEPVVSDAPEADQSDSVKTDLDDEVSGEEQGAVQLGESHTNEGEVSNSPLETAVRDSDTLETEAVKSLSLSDAVASETDSIDPPPFSVEDGEEYTADEEQGGPNEASPQIDPPRSGDNDQDALEPARSVPVEGEQGRSLDVDGDEFVQDAGTEKFAVVGALDTVDQVAETEGEVQSPSLVVSDGTDTSSSNSAELAEISEACDALVEGSVNSPQLPIDVEEIPEVTTNEQDSPTPAVETEKEEQLAVPEGETKSPSPTVPDAAESSPLASTDGSEDLSTGDALEEVGTTDSSQVILSPDTNEVLEVHKELEGLSGMEEVEDEQAVVLEREVEASSASGATETDPLDSADNREAGEEEEDTEGREFASTIQTSPSLDTEENVEVTSSEQDVPTSSREEGEEEQAVGDSYEVETPAGIDPNTTEVKSLSGDEVSGSIDTGETTDVLEDADAPYLARDADKTVTRDADEHDTPTSATDLEEEEVESVLEFDPVGETDADANSIRSDSSVECVTEGAVTDVAEKVDVPSESSLDATEAEDKTEQDAPASRSEFGGVEQGAAPDLETSITTGTVANLAGTSLFTSAQTSEVSETGDATEMVENDDVPRSFSTNADVVSEVGRNEEVTASPSDAAEVEEAANTDEDVPDATETTGLPTSAKIHPEMIETHDASNLEEKVHSSDLTSDVGNVKEVVDTQDAFISSEEVKDEDNTMRSISPGADGLHVGQDDQISDLIQTVETVIADMSNIEPAVTSVMSEELEEEKKALPCEDADVGDVDVSGLENSYGDISPFSSSSSNLTEISSPEKQQDPELQVNVPAITSNDTQISASVQGLQVPETFSTVGASSGVGENEVLVRQTESIGSEEVSGISYVDKPEGVLGAEVPVSIRQQVVIAPLDGEAESAPAEEGELPGPAGENTISSSASEEANVMLSPSTQLVVSALNDSEKEPEIDGTESEVQGLADATSDIPKDSERLKEKFFEVAHTSLEKGAGIQELISFVTENIGSPEVEGATLTEVKEPETSKSVDNILQSDTPLQSSTAEEKVIFTTDFKEVSSSTENEEESVDKGELLSYFPSPSTSSEESLEAIESTCKLANDGSLHVRLHSSGPSADAIPVLGDRDVEQNEISGYDNVSVKDIVTSDCPVETVKTVSASMPIASQVEDPLGSHDSKSQSLRTVTLSDIQPKEVFSLNEGNVAAKMKGDFLFDEENHPLTSQHLFPASTGSALPPSSGNEEDSSSRGVFAAEIPSIIQRRASASTNSPLQLGAQNVLKHEVSVPLSTYNGELNSSWVVVPSVGGSEVRSRPSEENIIEKEMPRLRAVARGGEERRSVSERDVPTASIADGKSITSVPKASTHIIRRDEDSNDSRFPLSLMLWCSQSLSSLFGSSKSL